MLRIAQIRPASTSIIFQGLTMYQFIMFLFMLSLSLFIKHAHPQWELKNELVNQ